MMRIHRTELLCVIFVGRCDDFDLPAFIGKASQDTVIVRAKKWLAFAEEELDLNSLPFGAAAQPDNDAGTIGYISVAVAE